MPSIMQELIMRKCDVSYKKAKQIDQRARKNLNIDDPDMLWSKALQAECFRVGEHIKEKEKADKIAEFEALYEVDIKPTAAIPDLQWVALPWRTCCGAKS